jgi:FAD synthetase
MVTLAFGTFDVLHIGHIDYLKQAKKIAMKDEFIIVVSRDKNAKKHSHKKLIHNEKERLEIIKHLDFMDKAVLGEKEEFGSLKRFKPKKIVLGYDQEKDTKKLNEFVEKNNLKIKIFRAKEYKQKGKKSSLIKKTLLGLN